MVDSRLPGLHRLPLLERRAAVAVAADLPPEAIDAWASGGLDVATADRLVENVVGTFALPVGVAVNFRVNGRDVLVPMVVEEPSVVAAASNMARLARTGGGFVAEADPSVMIGQIEIPSPRDPKACAAVLEAMRDSLVALGNERLPELVAMGGGVRGIEVRWVRYDEPGQPAEERVVLHVHVDCLDAMGANMVNTVVEGLAPEVEALTGDTVGLRILSNLADRRLARARVAIPASALGTPRYPGPVVAQGIASAWRFAWSDPYRAATHNKGVLNGVDAVVLATGNDWRAVEAGAHAFAARHGTYRPLTTWRVDETGALLGTIELPLQLGTVGGTLRVRPGVRANLALMGVRSARELAEIVAAVGLAQNLGALRALATSGIQEGHMRLHARSVALLAGAEGDEVETVVARLVKDGDFSDARASAVLADLRAGDDP
ncbi:MAG: hydroxymethylglutaryl-CoA reductase, degradative [Deltaproteobacteria bacterium]|nr:hydroxymethylglutaryl-CoA reductase, degradative [Deltaproteobacteria bacterium]